MNNHVIVNFASNVGQNYFVGANIVTVNPIDLSNVIF